jgi:hypothetical protein
LDGVFVRWEFRTEQHDIQFAVYRSDASGARQTVVEPRRIACQGKGLPEVGIVTCSDAPAKCKTYSIVSFFVLFPEFFISWRNCLHFIFSAYLFLSSQIF